MSQAQQHAVGAALGTVTAQTLIAAPQAGARIVIVGLSVAVGAAAAKVTLSFSATNQKVFELPINGNVFLGAMRWEGDAATALKITTSSAGPTDVSVDYVVEAA